MGHQLGVEAAGDGDRVEGPVGSDDAVKGAGAALGDEVGAVLGGGQHQVGNVDEGVELGAGAGRRRRQQAARCGAAADRTYWSMTPSRRTLGLGMARARARRAWAQHSTAARLDAVHIRAAGGGRRAQRRGRRVAGQPEGQSRQRQAGRRGPAGRRTRGTPSPARRLAAQSRRPGSRVTAGRRRDARASSRPRPRCDEP